MKNTVSRRSSISVRLTLMVAAILVMAVVITGSLALFEQKRELNHALETKATSLVQFMAQVTPLSILSLNFVEMNNDVKKVVLTDEDAVYAIILNEQEIPLVYFFKDTDPLVTGQVRDLVETRKPQAAIESLKQTGRILEVTAPIFSGEKRIGSATLGLSLDPLRRALLTQISIIAIFLVAIIGLSIAVLRLVLRQILYPVQILTDAATQISKGDLNVVLTGIERTDELGILARTFESMAGQLRELICGLEQHLAELKRTSQALRESEERFRTAFENANVGVCLVATDGHLLKVNAAMCQMFGYSQQELEQMTISSIAHPDDMEVSPKFIKTAIAGEANQTSFDKRYIHKEGHVVWGHVSSSLVRNPQGEPLYFISHVQDVTAQKQAQEALRESEERYHTLFAHAPDAIFLENADDQILDVNPAACTLLGYSREELLTMCISDIQISELRGQPGHVIKDELTQHGSIPFEGVDLRRDGTRVAVEISNSRIGDSGLALSIVRDITERKLAENALRESEEKYRLLHEHAGVGIGYYKSNGEIISYNKLAASHMKGKPEDFQGKSIYEVFPSAEAEFYMGRIRKSLETESIIEYEDHLALPSGEKWFLSIFRRICDTQQNVIGVQIISQDVTEQKQAEEALRESERRLVAAQHIAHVGYWERDFDANQVLLSAEACRIFGISEQALSLPLDEWHPRWVALIHPEDQPQLKQLLDDVLAGVRPYNVEYRVIRPDGVIRFIHSQAELKKDEAGHAHNMLGMMQDITERKQAEEALRASENRFRVLSETAFVGIYIIQDGRLSYVNSTLAKIFGYTPEELTGADPRLVIHPDDQAMVLENIRRRIDSEIETIHYEFRGRCKDGSIKNIDVLGGRIAFGGKTAVIGNLVDITERKSVEEALVFVAQRGWQTGAENFFDALAQFLGEKLDMDYVFIDRIDENPDVAETVALYAKGEIAPNMRYSLKGTPCENVMGRQLCIYPHGIQQLFPEDTLLPGMGAESYIGIPLWDSTGQPIGLIAALSNKPLLNTSPVAQVLQLVATRAAAELERWRSNRLLQAREHEFRTLAENLPDNIIRYDREGRIVYVNPVIEKTLGVDAEQMIGKRIREMYPNGSYEVGAQAVDAALASGENGEVEFTMPVLGKEELVHQIRTVVERDEHGEVTGALAIGRDITERKRVEKALRESEWRYREIFDNVLDGLYLLEVTTDGRFRTIEVNPALERITGIPRSLSVGKTQEEIVPAEVAVTVNSKYRRCVEAGCPIEEEVELDLPTGRRYFHSSLIPARDETGQIYRIIGISRDITEQKHAETALRASEERYRIVADNTYDWEFWIDPESHSLYNSPSCQRITGYTAEEFASDPGLLNRIIHPEDRAHFILHHPHPVKQQHGVANMVSDEIEVRILRADGTERHIGHVCQSILDEQGRYLGKRGSNRDITDRKRAEKEIHKLNQELEQRVRDRTAQLEAANKELEAFAYSVSHDLRAPLRHIDGFLELLQKRNTATLDGQSQHYMANISTSAKHMGVLIDDLLSFSRMGRQEMSKTQVNLEELVEDIVREFSPETEGRDIRWKIDPLPLVTGDRAMLRIVLVNFISNALKFTRSRPHVEIEIGGLPGDEKETVVFIRDNGVGFDMQYADKLFGVFQRLHRIDEFEGTGIGLANAQRIINRHGGKTWAEGEVDHGATFYFSLPQSTQGPSSAEEKGIRNNSKLRGGE